MNDDEKEFFSQKQFFLQVVFIANLFFWYRKTIFK